MAQSGTTNSSLTLRESRRSTLQRQGLGAGVSEYRIDFGPGHRVYFGKDEDTLIILLGDGTKKRQQKDIEAAQDLWQEYKQRKRQETLKLWL